MEDSQSSEFDAAFDLGLPVLTQKLISQRSHLSQGVLERIEVGAWVERNILCGLIVSDTDGERVLSVELGLEPFS